MKLRSVVLWLLLFGCVGHWSTPACAHDLKMTGVKVHLKDKNVAVSVIVHLHALKSGQNDTEISNELSQRLRVRLNEKPFEPRPVQLLRDKSNGIVIWQVESAVPVYDLETLAIEAPLFPERQNEKTIVTIYKDRQVWSEAVLDTNHPSLLINTKTNKTENQTAPPTDTLAIASRFAREGVSHIFGGPDHVLFLLSLLLLGGTAGHLLKIVTAFTLAHSITLTLAATGLFALPPRFAEPVIALSIVIVAALNLKAPQESDAKEKRADFRPYLAFGFGLIHGFGFAGALDEIGLPREALGWALGAFNVGVELGQAMLVILFAPALAALVKMWPRLQRPLVVYGSSAVALVGMYWFAERVFS